MTFKVNIDPDQMSKVWHSICICSKETSLKGITNLFGFKSDYIKFFSHLTLCNLQNIGRVVMNYQSLTGILLSCQLQNGNTSVIILSNIFVVFIYNSKIELISFQMVLFLMCSENK